MSTEQDRLGAVVRAAAELRDAGRAHGAACLFRGGPTEDETEIALEKAARRFVRAERAYKRARRWVASRSEEGKP